MPNTHLRAFEESLLTSAVRSDPDRLLSLLHEEFVEVGRSGSRWTRAEIVTSLTIEEQRAAPATDEWELIDLSPTLVLLTYRICGPQGSSRHTSLWDTAGDSPQMRFHQGTPIRDR